MKEGQVYKWFWEIKNKQEEECFDVGYAVSMTAFSELSDFQKFEIFVSKALKQHRDSMWLAGVDGTGRKLTEDELIQSVKLHCHSMKNVLDYNELAKEMNYDVEKAAQ